MTSREEWVTAYRFAWPKGVRHFLQTRVNMVGLECVCGDVFRAQCDVEPSGCAYAWILLMLSVAMHAWRCCALECDDDSESDDETNTMYT